MNESNEPTLDAPSSADTDEATIAAIYEQSAEIAHRIFEAMTKARVRELDVAGCTLHARTPRTNVGEFDLLTIDDDGANLLVCEPNVERYVHRDFHHLEVSPLLETIESFMEVAPAAFGVLRAKIERVAEKQRKALADIEAIS